MMSRDVAFATLAHESPAERLEAARYLQFWAMPADIPDLRAAIQREPVPWIRSALKSALSRLGDLQVNISQSDRSQDDEEANEDDAPLTRTNIAGALVHELSTSLAAVIYHIETEWAAFRGSNTEVSLEKLERFLRAIGVLAQVSSASEMARIDIAALIAAGVESAQQEFEILINVEGPSMLEIETDPGLVDLILANALKNACEAALESPNSPEIVSVIYNSSDREVWIAVQDNGVGLPPGGADNLFKIGHTTKTRHIGMGLSLCREAAISLDAEIHLSSETIGTRFELVIPLKRSRS